MNEINAFVQPVNQNFMFACGYYWSNADSEDVKRRSASVFKTDTSGSVNFIYTWGDDKDK